MEWAAESALDGVEWPLGGSAGRPAEAGSLAGACAVGGASWAPRVMSGSVGGANYGSLSYGGRGGMKASGVSAAGNVGSSKTMGTKITTSS